MFFPFNFRSFLGSTLNFPGAFLLKIAPNKPIFKSSISGSAGSHHVPPTVAPGFYRYMLRLDLLIRCLLGGAILGLRMCSKIDLDICLLNLKYPTVNEQAGQKSPFTIGSVPRNRSCFHFYNDDTPGIPRIPTPNCMASL